MKKTLALVLALAMVFSTITVAFAEDAIGADAQICADLGMLKGETGTVDAAYTATAPTRIQAAVMFLRLKGLEEEAKAFTGEANFADADKAAWAKPIMAYLKANPQLGWQGDGTNFAPTELTTAQAYYKVMLEALGYKQSTPEVVGDFAYADAITFAAGKGLTKVAAVTNFTVNDLAMATVEALKANMKEGGKTLVATLVEAGKVDKAKAIAASLYTDVAATTAAKVESVKAIANTKVLVGFDADVEKTFAENTANYAIVEKGTTTALAVSAAVLDGTDKVVLETAAQTAGKAYTLTVGTVATNFAGVAKDSSAPAIDDVEGTDTNQVTVTFDMMMDLTVLDIANYALNNDAKVVSAAWDDDEDRVAVVLTTEGLVANKGYKLTVTNVKSADGVVLKSDSDSFTATSDKKAPELENVYKKTNNRILVAFKETNDLNEEVAETIANYAIVTDNSAKTALEVISAKLLDKDNVDADADDEALVEIVTAAQKSGQRYELTVSNLVDDSVLANKMAESEDDTFNGVSVDEDGPEFQAVQIKTKNMIEVTFSEDGSSRLDKTSALDVANYSVNNDVTVEKVVFEDDDDDDCMVVRLTTSELGDDSSYKVTVQNVADEFGNEMDEAVTKTAKYSDSVEVAAKVVKASATDTETIVIEFSRDLDEATAEDVANYSINGDVGTPKSASYDEDTYEVTLETPEMDGNTKYKVTINGVKDIADNVLTSVVVNVVVATTTNDIEAPEIEDVVFVNQDVVRVVFNETMDLSPVPTIILSDGKVGTYKVSTDDDDKELEFKLSASFVAADEDKDITLASTTATDLAQNKAVADGEVIAVDADDLVPADVELLSYEQVSVKEFELQFSEKVQLIATNAGYSLVNGETTIGRSLPEVPYSVKVSVDSDDETLVYVTSTTVMDPDKEEFELVLANVLENKHNVAVTDSDVNEDDEDVTYLSISEEDDDAPYIEDIVAVDNMTVEITFSENLDSTTAETIGNYTIVDEDEDGISEGTASLDANVVTLDLGTKLDGGMTYTITVKNVEDIAGNAMDTADFDFDGSYNQPMDNYITGVKVISGTQFKLYTNSDVTSITSIVYGTTNITADFTIVSADGDGTDNEWIFTSAVNGTPATIDVIDKDYNANGDTLDVDLSEVTDNKDYNGDGDKLDTNIDERTTTTLDWAVQVLSEDVTYKVTAADADGSYTYSFDGTVKSSIDVTEEATNVYSFEYTDMELNDVVIVVDSTSFDNVTVDEDLYAELDMTGMDNVVDIMVIRDGVVIYFNHQFALADAN